MPVSKYIVSKVWFNDVTSRNIAHKPVVVIPNFHGPISRARNEDVGVERIPPDGVDCHVMGVDRVQELAGVRFGTFVDFALLGTDQEQIVDLLVEIE